MQKALALRQTSLELRTWGGKRPGAGPRRRREREALPHRARSAFRPYQPLHVTVRMADHVWNLRSQRSFAVVHAAAAALRRRADVRLVHFTILGNHLHLILEAEGPRALSIAMRSLSIRLARGLNRMMNSRGPVLEDRYHLHVLRTPAEVRYAVQYVLGNFASHARRRGERVSPRWIDPFSSAAARSPRAGQLSLWEEGVTAAPESWFLRSSAPVRTEPRGRTAGEGLLPFRGAVEDSPLPGATTAARVARSF